MYDVHVCMTPPVCRSTTVDVDLRRVDLHGCTKNGAQDRLELNSELAVFFLGTVTVPVHTAFHATP
eukprot:SAG22_NODE_3088_length_1952_cov_2.536427_4_plen_66_part_00